MKKKKTPKTTKCVSARDIVSKAFICFLCVLKKFAGMGGRSTCACVYAGVCVCVCTCTCSFERECAYPILTAQNILIYWLSVSPLCSLSLSLCLVIQTLGTGDLRKDWKSHVRFAEMHEETDSEKGRTRQKAREGCLIRELIQHPFSQGSYIIQIYELRSWPNQNLDLSARMPIYKHFAVGSGGDLAGASIHLLGPASHVERSGSGLEERLDIICD